MRLLDSLWERLEWWMVVGLHLLLRSYFLQLMKKRRDTVALPPEEGEGLQDTAAGHPGESPSPL